MLTRLLRSNAYGRVLLPPEIWNSHWLGKALATIEQRWPTDPAEFAADISPVFILAAGWGSGSTLVQRLVLSSGEVAVWGEPFHDAIPIPRLSLTIAPVRSDWPDESDFVAENKLQHFARQWPGRIMPPFDNFRRAHRAFYETWLARLAYEGGPPRWGFKEVRLTIDHARYLKWLFPKARFLFVYRDLYGSYLSCERVNWHSVWPSYKVRPTAAFAFHWRYLLEGFLSGYKEVEGMLVRYEDLVARKLSVETIARHIGVAWIDETVLEVVTGSRNESSKPSLPRRALLHAIAGDLRARLGYR